MASKVASLTLKEFFASKSVPKIVTLCGSQRIGSFNQIVHDYAVSSIKDSGAIVNPINLGELNLPLYNPNDEVPSSSAADGSASVVPFFPENAKYLKQQLVECDGIFIASPEYNGFTSPLLLNAITWASRGEGDMYGGFKGKIVSLMSTSPGPMGGLRMLRSMNTMLSDMGSVIVPGYNTIGNAYQVFDVKESTITDEKTKHKIDTACSNLVHYCRYEANREHDCEIYRELHKSQTMGEYGQVELPTAASTS